MLNNLEGAYADAVARVESAGLQRVSASGTIWATPRSMVKLKIGTSHGEVRVSAKMGEEIIDSYTITQERHLLGLTDWMHDRVFGEGQ